MDRFHRSMEGQDIRNGRECRFCHQMDPDFDKRKSLDRLVQSVQGDTASAHFTEDGYVKHRIAELLKKSGSIGPVDTIMKKSA